MCGQCVACTVCLAIEGNPSLVGKLTQSTVIIETERGPEIDCWIYKIIEDCDENCLLDPSSNERCEGDGDATCASCSKYLCKFHWDEMLPKAKQISRHVLDKCQLCQL